MVGKIDKRIEGPIGWIIFDNPDRRNAVSLEMWSTVPGIVTELVEDPAVRTIVLRGAGDKAFISGADISQFGEQRSSPEAVARYEETADRAGQAIFDSAKPTIAMIHGYCIGGGVGVALSCDIRVAGDDAQFAIPAGRIGLGYRVSAIKKLIDVVGPANAKQIFFTGDRFDAAQAAAFNLVNAVRPKFELEKHVSELAQRIAAQAPLTIKAFKQTANTVLNGSQPTEIARCEALIKACFSSRDYAEGRRAFAEKRTPVFAGK